jgi:hypothetical protein
VEGVPGAWCNILGVLCNDCFMCSFGVTKITVRYGEEGDAVCLYDFEQGAVARRGIDEFHEADGECVI